MFLIKNFYIIFLMDRLYKRETLIRTICFMSFFVGINVICTFLTTVLPLVGLLLIIFLPLTSAIVEITCKDRWFPIYAFATIGLSIAVSLSSIDFTIFYVVPSIFTGYIFGLFYKLGIPKIFTVFVASFVQTILSFAFIPLLELITGANLFDVFIKIFRISDRFWFDSTVLLVFFSIALIQTILSFIVVENELKKFGTKFEPRFSEKNISIYLTLLCSGFTFVFSLFYLPLSFLFLGFSYYFLTFLIIYQIKDSNKVLWFIDGLCVLIGMVVYAALNKYLSNGRDFALFATIPALISIVSMAHSFLKKSE